MRSESSKICFFTIGVMVFVSGVIIWLADIFGISKLDKDEFLKIIAIGLSLGIVWLWWFVHHLEKKQPENNQ